MYAYVHVDTSGCFRKLVPVFRGVVFIKTSKRLLINMAANIVNFAVVRYSYRDIDEILLILCIVLLRIGLELRFG